jgi:magnesium-transporting ATPase (P-type)
MSVIVKRLKANSMEVYVKGAPEVMPEICDPETCAYLRPDGTPTSSCFLIDLAHSPQRLR